MNVNSVVMEKQKKDERKKRREEGVAGIPMAVWHQRLCI